MQLEIAHAQHHHVHGLAWPSCIRASVQTAQTDVRVVLGGGLAHAVVDVVGRSDLFVVGVAIVAVLAHAQITRPVLLLHGVPVRSDRQLLPRIEDNALRVG